MRSVRREVSGDGGAPPDPDHSRAQAHEGAAERLGEILESMRTATPLLQSQHRVRLLSQVDVLTDSREGLEVLREAAAELVGAGVFEDGPWEDPERLVPALVPGTLRAGGHTTLMEILSELRLLAAANGEIELPGLPASDAQAFLREVLVNSFDLLFPGSTEEDRSLTPDVRTKIGHVMEVILSAVPLDRIKGDLASEIELICLQRPIVTRRAMQLIAHIREQLKLSAEIEEDRRLLRFVAAVHSPSPEAGRRAPEDYRAYLESSDRAVLRDECRLLSATMMDTGIAVGAHAALVRTVADDTELLASALGLNSSGRAELEAHRPFVQRLIDETVHPSTARAVYGLGRLLDRGILSQQPVRSGLERIRSLELHPHVEEILRRSQSDGEPSAVRVLLADVLSVLGQPLGIGQGRNPTCQSARGISLWSRHAPGKLLEMIRTVGRANDLEMRFEGALIRSGELDDGLLKHAELDHELDAVSLVLVPHLDRIYSEMMRRAAGRAEDPHQWVNPALYGHWIPTGFRSAYDMTTGRIREYELFLRTFYATHHPDFNRGHDLAYPNPVGIFLTSSSGALIGFHAVSILRVRREGDEVRVYLLNPNTEGRQRWHADISPTVAGHGEEPGESSLPFDQFVSRLYAFHYNPSDVGDLDAVDGEAIQRVERAARESWGRSYEWTPGPIPV